MDFNVGDTVRCISKDGSPRLKLGELYTVAKIEVQTGNDDLITLKEISDGQGLFGGDRWFRFRFELVCPFVEYEEVLGYSE